MSIYLDHAATCQAPEPLAKDMAEILTKPKWNCGTKSKMGLEAARRLEDIRLSFSREIGCERDELFFTSGGTESNNLGLHALSENLEAGVIWCSSTSHPCQKNRVEEMSKQNWTVEWMPTSASGAIAVDKLKELSPPDVVAFEWVNNEVGFIQPVDEILAELKKLPKYPNVTIDGVQGFAKLPFPSLNGVHSFSVSGHKLGAPVGVGAVFISRQIKKQPLFFGGGQENSWRSGTHALELIECFDVAYRDIQKQKPFKQDEVASFFDSKEGPKAFRHSSASYTPYIMTIDTSPVEGEVLMHHLDEQGIVVGLGSACSASRKKVSATHKAMGLSEKQSRSTIRFSFSPWQKREELENAANQIKNTWKELLKYF